MPEEKPTLSIDQVNHKVKQIEKRLEDVRIELLKDIGAVQASMTLMTEELSRLKNK